jgi:hypothetical protein
MATDEILRSYGDVSRVEDVGRMVEILTATEDLLYNAMEKVSAVDTVHNSLTDTLPSVGALSTDEGADYTANALTTPSRVTNIVEILSYQYQVSRTQQQIEHYHQQNELVRQRQKALKHWADCAEYTLLRSTLTSGASGTAPKMSGVMQMVSQASNVTAHSSGTTWVASILKGMMRLNWDVSNGDVATDVYMGSFLKNVSDDFTNKSTTVVTGGSQTSLTFAIDYFETGFGKVRLHPHRHIQVSGTDATGRVLGLNLSKCKVAQLKPTFIDTNLSRSGDYDKEAVVGKFTFECRNKLSNWIATGFDID